MILILEHGVGVLGIARRRIYPVTLDTNHLETECSVRIFITLNPICSAIRHISEKGSSIELSSSYSKW